MNRRDDKHHEYIRGKLSGATRIRLTDDKWKEITLGRNKVKSVKSMTDIMVGDFFMVVMDVSAINERSIVCGRIENLRDGRVVGSFHCEVMRVHYSTPFDFSYPGFLSLMRRKNVLIDNQSPARKRSALLSVANIGTPEKPQRRAM